jgi:uncharacterized protein (TIGR02147 family)
MLGSIFEYQDYKKFVNSWLDNAPQKGHGLRKKMAQAMDCQTAYVSHVFAGDYQLSSEQALKCAQWLNLSAEETDYFLLLVNRQRAGTKDLEKYYLQKITELRSTQVDLKKKSKIKESLSPKDQSVYYRHWLYAAIHMGVTIPQLQTIEGLQQFFGLPLKQITQVLNMLINAELIKNDKGLLKIGKSFIHLEKTSPLMQQHHTNWRLKAIDAIALNDQENLHYSGVVSLAKDDYEKFREKMANLLKDMISLAKDSEPETLASLNFDWFNI